MRGAPSDGRKRRWGVEPTPAGEAIAAIWRSIHARWPFQTASDYVLMPDHVHLLLLVDYRRAPGDFDLLGWWLAFRRAAAQRAVPLAGCSPGLFWEDKYWLQLLNAGRPLAAVRRYIKMNPARKVWKDRHPDFFALHVGVKHPVLDPELRWSAIGNLTLLSSPFLFPVVLTRRKPLEEHASAIADILDRAKRGAIPVSGFLSPAEKRVFELLRAEPDTRWIKTVPHALPPRFDPSVEDSRFLAEGRQLVLSSFPGIPAFPVIRENCLAMNARTAQMSDKAPGG